MRKEKMTFKGNYEKLKILFFNYELLVLKIKQLISVGIIKSNYILDIKENLK